MFYNSGEEGLEVEIDMTDILKGTDGKTETRTMIEEVAVVMEEHHIQSRLHQQHQLSIRYMPYYVIPFHNKNYYKYYINNGMVQIQIMTIFFIKYYQMPHVMKFGIFFFFLETL